MSSARLHIASTTDPNTSAPKMLCPMCQESWESRVLVSRGGVSMDGPRGDKTRGVWRRRECSRCGHRFSTHEIAVDCY